MYKIKRTKVVKIHLIFSVYCSPKKRAMLIELLNRQMIYPFEGRQFRGFTRPFCSEAPFGFLDVRCKQEIAPFVLRDLNAGMAQPFLPRFWAKDVAGEGLAENGKQVQTALLLFGFACLRWFTPLRRVLPAPGPSQYPLVGWQNVFFLGALRDPTTKEGDEIL